MATDFDIAYDQQDLRIIRKGFKAMDDQAQAEAKRVAGGLATYLQGKIERAAESRPNRAASRIATGSKVSKSDKTGAITYGYVGQKFSGGGNTQQLWGGFEFGSNRFKQFPVWSGREGRGSKGWFIYPTLREIQPDLIAKWENAFDRILKEW